jgi:mannose-1-phosphate guanylyltransferase
MKGGIQKVKVVILSGGSGLRLWPLTNSSRSKQYLNLLQGPNEGYESMIHRIWRQLDEVNLLTHTYLSTNKDQIESVLNQLGKKVRLIIEPEQRDTFPAIALTAAYLHSVEKIGEDEVIFFLPADHYVESHFFKFFSELEKILLDSNADILLLGVSPSKPSEKYGYIIPEVSNHSGYHKVKAFVEKPDEDTAGKLIKNHALWNCGVFAFKLKYLIDLLKTKGYTTEYNKLTQEYDQLPNTSFDIEVIEKSKNIIVVPFNGIWKDLGTWSDLIQVMETNISGKGIVSEDSTNVHLINELNIPVVINGLSNAVIAASQDGILISNKEKSLNIKPLVKDLQARAMVEEKRWGSYRVLDYETLPNGSKTLINSVSMNPGKNISYQIHAKRSEVWTITSGMGLFVLDGQMRRVTAGDVLVIPVGSKHAIKSLTELQFIEVQMGTDLLEEDIVRICMNWNEIEKLCNTGKQSHNGSQRIEGNLSRG